MRVKPCYMQNKILVIFVAVVLMQLIYFLVKSTKDRFVGGNPFLKGTAYVRGYIVLLLLVLFLIFMVT